MNTTCLYCGHTEDKAEGVAHRCSRCHTKAPVRYTVTGLFGGALPPAVVQPPRKHVCRNCHSSSDLHYMWKRGTRWWNSQTYEARAAKLRASVWTQRILAMDLCPACQTDPHYRWLAALPSSDDARFRFSDSLEREGRWFSSLEAREAHAMAVRMDNLQAMWRRREERLMQARGYADVLAACGHLESAARFLTAALEDDQDISGMTLDEINAYERNVSTYGPEVAESMQVRHLAGARIKMADRIDK